MNKRTKFPILDLQDTGSIELTIEQRFETVANVLKYQFFETYRIIAERYGWDVANDIATHVTDSSVPLIAEGYRKKFELDGSGAELLAKVFQAEFQAEGSQTYAPSEGTPQSAEFEVRCTFGDGMQRFPDVKIADGLCNRGCEGWMNEVGETVEPRVKATRLQWMGDGHERCRYRLDIAEGSDDDG